MRCQAIDKISVLVKPEFTNFDYKYPPRSFLNVSFSIRQNISDRLPFIPQYLREE
jgi:hypothetical protein